MPQAKTHRPSMMLYATVAIAITLVLSMVILLLPLTTVHRVYVTIGTDTIIDVSAGTTKVPYITTILPAQSYPTGVYTIIVSTQNITVSENNVPIGSYTFDLHNIETGILTTVSVQLERNGANVDTFTIYVAF